jgi:GNAT superfamily N-acetyltransferase
MAIAFHPLTPDRWPDLVRLFGPRGACAGCWCMYWRLRRSEWDAGKGPGNKRRFAAIVRKGGPTGVLAYDGDDPVGWCAVAPRSEYPGLDRSRILAAVDEEPVWSISCFYILSRHRRRGLSLGLLQAATDFARSQGARILEGYPHDARKKTGDAFLWTGVAPAFARAGFVEVARRSPTRPIMRKKLGN